MDGMSIESRATLARIENELRSQFTQTQGHFSYGETA